MWQVLAWKLATGAARYLLPAAGPPCPGPPRPLTGNVSARRPPPPTPHSRPLAPTRSCSPPPARRGKGRGERGGEPGTPTPLGEGEGSGLEPRTTGGGGRERLRPLPARRGGAPERPAGASRFPNFPSLPPSVRAVQPPPPPRDPGSAPWPFPLSGGGGSCRLPSLSGGPAPHPPGPGATGCLLGPQPPGRLDGAGAGHGGSGAAGPHAPAEGCGKAGGRRGCGEGRWAVVGGRVPTALPGLTPRARPSPCRLCRPAWAGLRSGSREVPTSHPANSGLPPQH